MDSRLATSGLQALITELRLRASATTNSVEAQAAAVLLDAAVEYLLLKADATIGEFVKKLAFFEAVDASDVAALTVAKPFGDTQSTVDQLVLVMAKVLVDAVGTAEVLLFDTTKTLADTFDVADTPEKALTKSPIFDAFFVGDAAAVVPEKGLFDGAYFSEGPASSQTYADPTYFAEDYVREGYPIRAFSKALSDVLDATDDFLGVANVDDDQIIFFSKTNIEHVASYDLAAKAFDTSRTDGVSAADIVLLTTSRPATSAFGVVDLTVKAIAKASAENVTSADAGTLRMTDYADISYFAQDYVGTSTSF
jgi:hypothetical protein